MTTTGASKRAALGPIGADSLGSLQGKRKRKTAAPKKREPNPAILIERIAQLEAMLKDSHNEVRHLREKVEDLKREANQPSQITYRQLKRELERFKAERIEAARELTRRREENAALRRNHNAILNALRETQGLPAL